MGVRTVVALLSSFWTRDLRLVSKIPYLLNEIIVRSLPVLTFWYEVPDTETFQGLQLDRLGTEFCLSCALLCDLW